MITKKTKALVLTGFSFLIILMILSCASGGVTKDNASFSDVQGRDWVLVELKSGANSISIKRPAANGMGEIYTLKFDADRLSGVGAPNRYFAPFTAGDGHTLSIGMIAGTLMAPLFENEDLKEQEFFGYLNRVNRWELVNKKLELYSSSENNTETILVFIPAL